MIAVRLAFVAVALVCALLGIYLAASSRGEARLAQARAAVLAGRDAHALAELEGLRGETARRASALRGYAYLGLGKTRAARTELRKAVRRDPNNWILQRDYAIVLLQIGDRENAKARIRRARGLNPRMPLPRGFVDAE